jgi:ketosteroid isomerase-like protein
VTDDPRIALIHQAFADFAARDAQALAAFLHPEVESRVYPPLLNTGTWHGPAGFAAMTRGWEEAFGFVSYDVRGIEPIDQRNLIVAVHQEAAGAGSGAPVALDVYFLIELDDDRAIRFQVHADRDSALQAV